MVDENAEKTLKNFIFNLYPETRNIAPDLVSLLHS